MNKVRHAKYFFEGRSVNSFRHKSTVGTRRGIVSFGKRYGKKRKRNLVTLDNDIQNELRNF